MLTFLSFFKNILLSFCLYLTNLHLDTHTLSIPGYLKTYLDITSEFPIPSAGLLRQ